ncbi:N-acylneuraminate cytidylyltransferase [compost metagenome]
MLEPVMGHTGALLRQQLPVVYMLNGAVYVTEIKQLKKTKTFLSEETSGYVMPKERSIDIDSLLDFHICEAILQSEKGDF